MYRWESFPCLEIAAIIEFSVFFPRGALQYHDKSSLMKLSMGLCQRSCLSVCNLDIYFKKDSTGHPGFPVKMKQYQCLVIVCHVIVVINRLKNNYKTILPGNSYILPCVTLPVSRSRWFLSSSSTF